MIVPVYTLVVTFAANNFWSEVIGCAAQRPCDIWDFFCESEICDLQMSVSVQEQILGLQVTVNYVARVQIVESQGHFSGVELCDWVREPLSIVSRLFLYYLNTCADESRHSIDAHAVLGT